MRYLLEKFRKTNKLDLLVNTRDSALNTPLHSACIHNRSNIVTLLTQNFGIDLSLRNLKDQTPLHVCCDNSNLAIFKFLFESCQNTNKHHIDLQMMRLIIESGSENASQFISYLISQDLSYLYENYGVNNEDLFDMAFNVKDLSILQVFIEHPNWMKYLGICSSHRCDYDYSRFKKLVQFVPNLAVLILDKFVHSEKCFDVYDFKFLEPKFGEIGNDFDQHPMKILSDTENSQIVSHKVLQKLVTLKWDSRGRCHSTPVIFFTLNLLFYLIYLVALTILLIKVHNETMAVFSSKKSIKQQQRTPIWAKNISNVMSTNMSSSIEIENSINRSLLKCFVFEEEMTSEKNRHEWWNGIEKICFFGSKRFQFVFWRILLKSSIF